MRIVNKWFVAKETRREWIGLHGFQNVHIKKALEELGDNPQYEDVARITNYATEIPKCDECKARVEELLELGDKNNNRNYYICLKCLLKGFETLDS